MSANAFLLINGLIVLFLILRIFFGRKTGRPTPISLPFNKSGDWQKPNLNHSPMPEDEDANPQFSKSLNCLFQYEGRSWDAYEVLGVAAGADQKACHRALVDLRRNGQHSDGFLQALWEALLKQNLS